MLLQRLQKYITNIKMTIKRRENMKRAVLILYTLIIALVGYTCVSYVKATSESGSYIDETVQETTNLITQDGLAINPASYYVTTNSFDVKTDANFSDLVTEVYDAKTRKQVKTFGSAVTGICHDADWCCLPDSRSGKRSRKLGKWRLQCPF